MKFKTPKFYNKKLFFFLTILFFLFFSFNAFAQTMERTCNRAGVYDFDFDTSSWDSDICSGADCKDWNIPGYCSRRWGWFHEIGDPAGANYCAWQICNKVESTGDYECVGGITLDDLVINAEAGNIAGWQQRTCFTPAEVADADACWNAGGFVWFGRCWQFDAQRDFAIITQEDCGLAGGFFYAPEQACWIPQDLLLEIDPYGSITASCNVPGEEKCLIVLWYQKGGLKNMTKTTFNIGQPPEDPRDLNIDSCPCSVEGNYLVAFKWIYEHALMHKQESFKIRIEIDNDPVFDGSGNPVLSGTEFKCGGDICEFDLEADSGEEVRFDGLGSISWGQWLGGIVDGQEKWGRWVYWMVKVKDENGLWSDWSEVHEFELPPNAYPWINTATEWWDPEKPKVGVDVIFGQESNKAKCFDYDSGGEYCGTEVYHNHFFSWQFPYPYYCIVPDIDCETEKMPIVQFLLPFIDPQKIVLEVTDSQGLSCEDEKAIQTERPLPKYREVAPIIPII